MIVRCTRKLLRELGIRGDDLGSEQRSRDLFGDWHANLLHVDRRKCLLLTDTCTLFTVFVPAILKRDLQDFSGLLRASCARALSSHGIDCRAIPKLDRDEPVVFGKTNNRHVLGSMNDYAFHFKFHIASEGGLGRANIERLNHRLSKMPLGAIGYKYSIEAVEEELGRLAT